VQAQVWCKHAINHSHLLDLYPTIAIFIHLSPSTSVLKLILEVGDLNVGLQKNLCLHTNRSPSYMLQKDGGPKLTHNRKTVGPQASRLVKHHQ
jgi:hypothetical protein